MKVCVLVPEYPTVSETWVVDHIRALAAAGYAVTVASLFGGNYAAGAEGSGVSHLVLLSSRHGWRVLPDVLRSLWFIMIRPRLFARLVRFVLARGSQSWFLGISCLAAIRAWRDGLDKDFDVVHAHHGSMGVVGDNLVRLGVLRGRFVVSFHGTDVCVHGRRRPVRYKSLFAGADLLLVNTQFLAEQLVSIGAPSKKVRIHPIGVDPHVMPFRLRMRPEGRPLEVVTVARLVPVKGVDVAIRAMARLQEMGVSFRYRIVGDGPLKDELVGLARKLGVEVEFVGAIGFQEVVRMLDQADCFLLTSRIAPDGSVESQGRVFIEAQAMGLPVIATAVGGIPEAVAPGTRLLPPENVDAVANEIRRLLDDSEKWPTMSERGRAFVCERYDVRRLNKHLIAMYAGICSGKR